MSRRDDDSQVSSSADVGRPPPGPDPAGFRADAQPFPTPRTGGGTTVDTVFRRVALPRRLRRALVPGLAAALVAGTVVLAAAPEQEAGAMAAGVSTSFVDGTGTATSAEVAASNAPAEIDAAGTVAGGTVSVVVLDVGGETVISSKADDSVSTASLVKLLVVVQLMELDAAV